MESALLGGVKRHFHNLPDPRRETKNMRHDFLEVLTVALCGVLCGADDWVSVARFGEAKREWFETFLELPHGIPSHDTFSDIFAKINPEAFQRSFSSWASSLASRIPGDIVAVDGKTLRGSYDRASSKAAIHMVSAWSTANELVLGQLKTEEKSNEITAIPKLLELLALDNCLVTIDAMGCQRRIAQQILDKGADYLLSVKDNQPTLHEAIHDLYLDSECKGFTEDFSDLVLEEGDKHGRVDRRTCRVSTLVEGLGVLTGKWPGVRSLIVIEQAGTEKRQRVLERRVYISSRVADAKYFLDATRKHWQIENKLHWVLDVAYREDAARQRDGYSSENLAVLRHITLNLLKNEKSDKAGIKNKRLRAGWDLAYLAKVLSGLSI
jgi:predicted transposase YbfD/YdcC